MYVIPCANSSTTRTFCASPSPATTACSFLSTAAARCCYKTFRSLRFPKARRPLQHHIGLYGKTLASCSLDRSVCLFDNEKDQIVQYLTLNDRACCVKYSPIGRTWWTALMIRQWGCLMVKAIFIIFNIIKLILYLIILN